jgi:glutamate racemase
MSDVVLVQCPDCDSTLTVDRKTGAVLAHQPAVSKNKLTSLEDAAKENVRRRERAEDLFAATVEREKHKSEILEKTFKQALENAQKNPAKPRGIFDDD